MKTQIVSTAGPGARSLDIYERVRQVQVRMVRPEEISKWDHLIREHHYLGLTQMVGETIRHVAEINGEWVALLGWATAALKVRPRDTWIGWTPEQQYRRLRYVTNNVRYLILPGHQIPNLASRILALSTRRLAADWQAVHGHPVVLAETFVDPAQFSGTCYRAAGWECLGQTQGYGRHGRQWVVHDRPKTIWVRPLRRPARTWLTASFEPPALHPEADPAVDLNQLPMTGPQGLLAALAAVPDHRHRRGVRHPYQTILAVAACAVLAGARSFCAIADWAATLTPDLLQRLGCRRSPRTGQYEPPSEPTLRRTLEAVDADCLDRVVGQWLTQQARGEAIAFDGKTIRGSGHGPRRPRHLLAAVIHKTAVVVGQKEVEEKTNEIKKAKPLLDPLDLTGKVVTADAMHTQVELANYLVEDKQADYVFVVKDNQSLLKKVLQTQVQWDFSPPLPGDGEGSRSD